MWDAAEVPESIPLSPLLPQGREMRSDVDSSPPPSLSLTGVLCLYFSVSSPTFIFLLVLIVLFLFVFFFPPLPSQAEVSEMLDCHTNPVN